MDKVKTICFDLDGVICSQTKGDYENAVFDKTAILLINKLYDEGFRIIIYTSRFMGRSNSDVIKAHKLGYHFTLQQLKKKKIKFHELIMGKPRYDLLIDNAAAFFQNDWKKIEKEIRCLKN